MSCGTHSISIELVQASSCKLLHGSSGMLKQEVYIDNLAIGRTLG